MADWHPECDRRATAYVTDRRGRLLVFEYVDMPAVGTGTLLRPVQAMRINAVRHSLANR